LTLVVLVAHTPLVTTIAGDQTEDRTAGQGVVQHVTTRNINYLTMPGNPVTAALPVNSTAPAGSIVRIPITISNNTVPGFYSYTFSLTFDPAVLQASASSANSTGTLSGSMLVESNALTPGIFIVAAAGTAPQTSDGILLYLDLLVTGGAQSSTPINFQSITFDEGMPAASAVSGSFSAQAPPPAPATVAGRITTSSGKAVNKVTLTLTNGSGFNRTAMTNGTGNYTFTGIPVGQTYRITPSLRRTTFNPAFRDVDVTADVSNINFVSN
jgi:hypothetical protein